MDRRDVTIARAARTVAASIVAAALVATALPASGEAAPAPSRARELVHLLKQDCGSCHGLTLKGGLGPPLTAQALRSRPADALVATIVHGRPGTAMPPWRRFISEDEARWLVQTMLEGIDDAR
jgi:cytochrome c55X